MSMVPGPSTSTVMAPPDPSGTTAAFARARMLASQFSVETLGVAPPAGKTRRSPRVVGAQTAKLNETAWASEGIPHWPDITNVLCVPPPRIDGGPYPEGNPLVERVSMTRHGVTATKGRGTGLVTNAWRSEASASRPLGSALPSGTICGAAQ